MKRRAPVRPSGAPLCRIGSEEDPDVVALKRRMAGALRLPSDTSPPRLRGPARALARLLGEAPVKRFLARTWGKAHAVLRDPRRAAWLSTLCTRSTLEHLLAEGRIPSAAVQSIAQAEPPPSAARARRGGAARLATERPICVAAMHLHEPALRTLCQTLERELRMPTTAAAIDLPRGTRILPLGGEQSTFLLLVEGNLEGSVEAAPHGRRRTAVSLRAGDCLYLCPGQTYAPRPGRAAAFLLSLSLREMPWAEALKWLGEDALMTCGEDLFFRRNCPTDPSSWTRADLEYLEEALRRFHQAFRLDEADDLMEDCYLSWSNATAGAPGSPAAGPLDGEIDHDTELFQTRSIFFVRKSPEHLILKLGKKKILFPTKIGEAFDHVTQRERFRVRDLPALTPASQLVLARRLVREGFVSRSRT